MAAFAGVGAVLVGGIGLNALGTLEGDNFWIAVLAAVVAGVGVIVALSLITAVLTPNPITISHLADLAGRRRSLNDEERELLSYIENDPTLLQGIVDASLTPASRLLIEAREAYERAVDDRFRTADAYWRLAAQVGAADPRTKNAEGVARVAASKASTMHDTITRLERVTTGRQAVISFQKRTAKLVGLALTVALAIGVFAAESNPSQPAAADLRGANLNHVDLSGASLRGANLSGMTIKDADLHGTNLEDANVDGTIWKRTICPDGTRSGNAGGTCDGHLSDAFTPESLR
jgi:hypothetical protein